MEKTHTHTPILSKKNALNEDQEHAVLLTHALALVVLVDEDVVQNKVQQLVLQSVVWVEHQRLQALPAARHQLMTEDHQQITEQHEGLRDARI